MSDFREKLTSITENEIKTILNNEQAADFEIVNRGIIPIGSVEVSVEGNTNADIQTFQINRYFDGVDLSSKYIRIGFQTIYGTSGYTDAANVVVSSSDDVFYFDWVIDSNVTIGAGKIKVKIEFYEKDSQSKTIYSWNTREIELKILPTISIFGNAVERDYTLEQNFYNVYDNSTTYDDIHDTDHPIVIEGRDILLTDRENIVVERDTRSQIITFVMNRNEYDFDPADMTIAIGFENAVGQSDWSVCVNRIVTDNDVTFGWLLDSKVAFESGDVKFRVELMGYNSKNEWMDWKTKYATFIVHKSFPIDTRIFETDPSFEQKWIVESEEVLNQCKSYAEDAEKATSVNIVTDWDDAVTTGYYYSVNFDDLNHPPMGDSYYSGSVVAFEGYVRQTVCGLVTNKYMTRFKGGTGVWSAWEYVSPNDAKKITFESNTDILSTTVQSAIQEVYDKKVDAKAILITDWNDAVNPGVYFSSSSAANKPPSPLGDDWFGQVFVYNDRVKQILTHASSAPIGIERWVRSRWSSSQPWSEWSQSFKNATSTSNGLMSSTDKAKLDGLDAYTKSDSRQQFANAFVGEKSGAMVSLSDAAEDTLLRKAEVQGATTEVLANPEAEKSPDNIATISGTKPTKMTVSGKNIFDMDNCFPGETREAFGITFTKVSDGILANGMAERQSYTIPYDMLPELKAGRTYTVSTNEALAVPNFKITKPGGTENKETYLVDGTETKIEAYFYFNAGVVANNLLVQFQLEEDSTPTAYEPYSGTDYPLPTLEPLMSLPNGVCDEYDAVTGVETRRIGKRTLNGTETYRITAQTNTDRISVSQTDKKLTNGLCSHFATGLIGDEKPGTIDMRASDMTTFFVVEKNAYTVESWKAYLSAQLAAGTPVTIYYELAEPVITQHGPETILVVYPATNVYADDGNVFVVYNRDSNRVYGDLSDALSDKVDKMSGKGLSTNDYTTAEKQKLAGIAQNANNYVHPTTSGNKHIPSGGADKQILRWGADGTATWDEEIDAYTKAEIDSKFDAINTIMVPMLIKFYGIREAMHQFVSAYAGGAEDLSPIVGRFFEAAASTIGETYTTQFYKYSANTSTEGVKLDDNAGLICTPSTIAAAGTDDYADLPLFACFDCNYTIDADTLEPVIHAIKDVYGEFTATPTDSLVGVMQMTGWVRRTSGETTKTVEYKAQKADGFEPLPEAVRALDNTVRPFVVHAKYAAGYNSAGLLSSVSGVQPATLRTGSNGSTSISHNGQIAKWREWGSQYCGSSLCDIAFVQLMLEIKYAVLGSAQVMQGCRTYSTSTYQAAVSESGVTRVLLTAANAAYFVVGSCVSLGSGNNRAAATCYDICDISKITSIEDVTIDDVAYKAINLDTETTFNTTTDTYIIPQPWRTGSTDDVPGNDGSPYSNTNGKEPFKIQGIELMLGMSEVPADTTLYEDTEKYTVYANRKASDIASGNSGTNPVTVGTIQKETDAGWKSIAELNWDANDQEAYMLAQEVGGSPTTGYCARVYLDAAATTGWREWPAFCGLTGGSSGGFACAGLYAGIGTVGWDIGARACGSGGNRGGFTSAYEEDMPT